MYVGNCIWYANITINAARAARTDLIAAWGVLQSAYPNDRSFDRHTNILNMSAIRVLS